MPRYTQEQLQDHFRRLPPQLQDALYDADIAERTYEIGRKHGLTIEQIGILAEESGFITLGLAHPEEYVGNLARALKLDTEKAKMIAADMNHVIFFPLRDILKQTHQFDLSQETVQKGLPSIIVSTPGSASGSYVPPVTGGAQPIPPPPPSLRLGGIGSMLGVKPLPSAPTLQTSVEEPTRRYSPPSFKIGPQGSPLAQSAAKEIAVWKREEQQKKIDPPKTGLFSSLLNSFRKKDRAAPHTQAPASPLQGSTPAQIPGSVMLNKPQISPAHSLGGGSAAWISAAQGGLDTLQKGETKGVPPVLPSSSPQKTQTPVPIRAPTTPQTIHEALFAPPPPNAAAPMPSRPKPPVISAGQTPSSIPTPPPVVPPSGKGLLPPLGLERSSSATSANEGLSSASKSPPIPPLRPAMEQIRPTQAPQALQQPPQTAPPSPPHSPEPPQKSLVQPSSLPVPEMAPQPTPQQLPPTAPHAPPSASQPPQQPIRQGAPQPPAQQADPVRQGSSDPYRESIE